MTPALTTALSDIAFALEQYGNYNIVPAHGACLRLARQLREAVTPEPPPEMALTDDAGVRR